MFPNNVLGFIFILGGCLAIIHGIIHFNPNFAKKYTLKGGRAWTSWPFIVFNESTSVFIIRFFFAPLAVIVGIAFIILGIRLIL